MEERNSWAVEFKREGKIYRYESSVDCSCANVYYAGVFTLDGQKKTARLFSSLVKDEQKLDELTEARWSDKRASVWADI